MQEQVPLQALARVTSYDWLMSLGAMPAGYAVAPLAAHAWGEATPLVGAAVLVVLSCAGTAAVPAVRRLTWQATPAPQPVAPTATTG
ncbi:hypothetical protein [Micromonospora psammae]|uniref:hypothetical protein n=1 Tax=Micromonospora sp. CPCC 205556 TaxID=3122398 RepID=UPI002FF1AC12